MMMMMMMMMMMRNSHRVRKFQFIAFNQLIEFNEIQLPDTPTILRTLNNQRRLTLKNESLFVFLVSIG